MSDAQCGRATSPLSRRADGALRRKAASVAAGGPTAGKAGLDGMRQRPSQAMRAPPSGSHDARPSKPPDGGPAEHVTDDGDCASRLSLSAEAAFLLPSPPLPPFLCVSLALRSDWRFLKRVATAMKAGLQARHGPGGRRLAGCCSKSREWAWRTSALAAARRPRFATRLARRSGEENLVNLVEHVRWGQGSWWVVSRPALVPTSAPPEAGRVTHPGGGSRHMRGSL